MSAPPAEEVKDGHHSHPPAGGYPVFPPGVAPYPPAPNAGAPPYPAPGVGAPPYPAPPAPGIVAQPYPPPGATPYPHPGAMPAPITTAPAGGDFHQPLVCPPGLEYLTMVDQLLVHQKVELLEAFTGFETKNKYEVKNSLGQKVYYAKEDTDCCTRNCCGPQRPFDMKILDNFNNEVIHLYRPLRCDSCLCPCCLQKLEVTAPPGTTIGYVTQQWSILRPKFHIEDAAGQVVLQIEGPICTWSLFCKDVEFKVLSADGTNEVGRITKQWSGLAREAFTDADHFGISFPMDLNVNIKAVMLGACFLIDFMFFEKSQNAEHDAPGML